MKQFPSPRTAHRNLARVLAVPLLLLVASLAGLIIGLMGDGWTDWASAALLLLPLLALAIAWHRRG